MFGDRNTVSLWVLWATPTRPWLKDAKDSRETPLGRTTALKPRSRDGISTEADASTSYIHDLGTVPTVGSTQKSMNPSVYVTISTPGTDFST